MQKIKLNREVPVGDEIMEGGYVYIVEIVEPVKNLATGRMEYFHYCWPEGAFDMKQPVSSPAQVAYV